MRLLCHPGSNVAEVSSSATRNSLSIGQRPSGLSGPVDIVGDSVMGTEDP